MKLYSLYELWSRTGERRMMFVSNYDFFIGNGSKEYLFPELRNKPIKEIAEHLASRLGWERAVFVSRSKYIQPETKGEK